jgi:hypothetical protein
MQTFVRDRQEPRWSPLRDLSRRGILTGSAIALAALPVLPALAGGGSAAKAFLADIYQRYVGSSAGTAKGISLNSVKTVRSYFTFGLASPIIEDRAAAAKRGEPPVLDGDPFIGTQGWDISNLAIEVKDTGTFKCQHDWRASARCSAAARRDLSNEASRRRHRLR